MRFLGRSLTALFLLAATLGILALAASVMWSALEQRRSREATPRPARERVFVVDTVVFTPARVTPELSAFGEVRSRRALDIRASTGGTIVELADSFEEGGQVTAGEMLLRIDPTDFADALDLARTDLIEAEADRLDAEAALTLARDDLASARRQSELRNAALARQNDLVRRGVGTEAAVENAALAAASAEQAVLARRQSVASAEARVTQAANALGRRRIALAQAERRLAETELFAGFSGTLSEVNVVKGGLVTQNERLARLIDPAALEVSFRVSTAQYARLIDPAGALVATPVEVRLDVAGVDLVASGRINRESAAVGEGQTGRLLFARLDKATGFRPGDFVTVAIQEPALEGVAVLPAAALDAAGRVLVLGEDDRLEQAQVSLVRRQGDNVLVRGEGLDGRQVVAERSPVLGVGIRVRAAKPAATPQDGAGVSGSGGAVAPGGLGGAGQPGETVALAPGRRAALVAFVQGNARMPAEAKARILKALEEDEVPLSMVERLESRMGG